MTTEPMTTEPMTTEPVPGAAGAEGNDRGLALLLVSPDLFTSSRIAGLARDVRGTLTTLRGPTQPTSGGPWDLVLVDLQALAGDPETILAGVRAGPARPATAGGPVPRIVAFGPHVAKERLERALAAGAHAAVSRGELLGDFAAVIARAVAG